LGYMRELGEGIPRMFEEMEREGFYPPRFDDIGGVYFQVRLRNEPVYDTKTLLWLRQFNGLNLTGDQKRILVCAKVHGGRFKSREYQKLTGLDMYRALMSIRNMIRRGIVRSTGKGSRVYEINKDFAGAPVEPPELVQLLPELQRKGELGNSDVTSILKLDRQAALRVTRRLVRDGWLVREGQRKWTRYRLPS